MSSLNFRRIWESAAACCVIAVFCPSQELRAQESDPVETARRELKELPAAEHDADRLAPTNDLNKYDLELPANADVRAKNPRATLEPQSKSTDWLLDALKKPSEKNQLLDPRLANPFLDRKAADTARGPDPSEQGKTSSHSNRATNALAPFLDRWLSPANRGLLNTGSGEAVASGSAASQRVNESFFDSKSVADLGQWWSVNRGPVHDDGGVPILTGDATYRDPLAQRPNPYLDADTLRRSWDSQPKTSDLVTPPWHPNDSAPLASPSYSGSGDQKPASEPVKKDEELPPPNAPLINDQKYFPQLQRF